jgi:hypothetical protein
MQAAFKKETAMKKKKAEEKEIPVYARIRKEEFSKLQEIKERTGLSVADLLRAGIRHIIKTNTEA